MQKLPQIIRPTFLACGDSLTEYGFHSDGWIDLLMKEIYPKRNVDIRNRGFAGYNTRWFCQQILPAITVDPHPNNLVTICFGANDCVLPDNQIQYSYQHVPLAEFIRNLEMILDHFGEKGKVILLTPPPNDAEKYQRIKRDGSSGGLEGQNEPIRRRLDYTQMYVDEVLKLGLRKNVVTVDIFNPMVKELNWSSRFLSDGIHLTGEGNQFVFNKIMEISPKISNTDSDPFLYWKQCCLSATLE